MTLPRGSKLPDGPLLVNVAAKTRPDVDEVLNKRMHARRQPGFGNGYAAQKRSRLVQPIESPVTPRDGVNAGFLKLYQLSRTVADLPLGNSDNFLIYG